MTATPHLKRPKQLTDEVWEDPIKLIDTVFDELDITYFIDTLNKWLRASLSLKRKPYDERQGQLALTLFYERLQFLIQSLYFFRLTDELNDDLRTLREELRQYNVPILNTLPEITKDFCSQYTLDYSRNELKDWMINGVLSCENDTGELDFGIIICTYESALLLTEAAYALNVAVVTEKTKNHE